MNTNEEEVLGATIMVGLIAFVAGLRIGYRQGKNDLLLAINSAQRFGTQE